MRVSTWCDFFAGKPGLPKVDLHPGMPVDEVYSEWEPGDYWYERQCSAIRRLPQGVPIIAERENPIRCFVAPQSRSCGRAASR